MSSFNNVVIKKINYNNVKVKKWYHDGVRVFISGNIVTYYVNSNTVYKEEVDSEKTCLNPSTFTPTLAGYTFVGWREDTTASSDVLSTKVMGDEPVSLYAVFKKTFTATFNGNGSTTGTTSSITGTQYYNNGNALNPVITLPTSGYTKDGYNFAGWNYGASGAQITLSSDITVYAQWTAINYTVTYTIAGAIYKETRTIGQNCLNPSTFAPTVDSATFQGWSETPGVASILTSKTMGTSDITLYAVYQYNNYLIDGTGTINCEAAEHSSNGWTRTIDGSKYYAVTFSYNIGYWSGAGGAWLYVKNSAGAELFAARNYGDYNDYTGTGNVTIPVESCTIEAHCWQDEEGGASCNIENATVYGRQCVG